MVHTKVSRLLIACAIVAIFALGFVFFSSNRFFLSQQVGDIGSDTVSEFKDTTRGGKNEVDQALLIPLVAEVAVNTSGEWQLVSEPTPISQGVGGKTDAIGQAKIIFADGSVLSLDSSTQITLDLLEYKINGASDVDSANGAGSAHQRVKIFQVIGKTWSQVEKLLSPLFLPIFIGNAVRLSPVFVIPDVQSHWLPFSEIQHLHDIALFIIRRNSGMLAIAVELPF